MVEQQQTNQQLPAENQQQPQNGIDDSSQTSNDQPAFSPNLLHGFEQKQIYTIVPDGSPEPACDSPSQQRFNYQSVSFGQRSSTNNINIDSNKNLHQLSHVNSGSLVVMSNFGSPQEAADDQEFMITASVIAKDSQQEDSAGLQPGQSKMQTAQLSQMIYDFSQQNIKTSSNLAMPPTAHNSPFIHSQQQAQGRKKPQISPMKSKPYQKMLAFKGKQSSFHKLTSNANESNPSTTNTNSGYLSRSKPATKSQNNMSSTKQAERNQSSSTANRMFPLASKYSKRGSSSAVLQNERDQAVIAQSPQATNLAGPESQPFSLASDYQLIAPKLSSHLKQFYERKTFGSSTQRQSQTLSQKDQRRQKSADLTTGQQSQNAQQSSQQSKAKVNAPVIKVTMTERDGVGSFFSKGSTIGDNSTSNRLGAAGERLVASQVVIGQSTGQTSNLFRGTNSKNISSSVATDVFRNAEQSQGGGPRRTTHMLKQPQQDEGIPAMDDGGYGAVDMTSFISQEKQLRSPKRTSNGHSPNRVRPSVPLSTSKLHEKVIWFYRRLCEEYDCPILPQFIQETIPTAFKLQNFDKKRKGSLKSNDSNNLLLRLHSHSPRRSPHYMQSASVNNLSEAKQREQNQKNVGKKHKNGSGVVQLNTSILSDKTVQAVCDTLRRFQQKIKVFELYHNQAFRTKGGGGSTTGGKNSPNPGSVHYRMSSPSRTFQSASGPWTFPKPSHLFSLLKSLSRTSIVRVISDNDCPILVTEQHYQNLIASIGRAQGQDVNQVQLSGRNLLSFIEIQGFHVKPSFVKHLVNQIRAKKFTKLINLSLQNCQIQDSEGQELCKVAILGKVTPNLKVLCLAKNQLGFKFGASLIAQLIDAQSIAQEETMNAVVGSSAPNQQQPENQILRFGSLDHFVIDKIDLEYNKISMLVIRAVEQQLKNLHQFKEQAKLHENMFQLQSTNGPGGRSAQQGSSSLAQTIAHQMTGGGFSTNSNYELQPNKVIIEQTEESSISSSGGTSENSLDKKELPKLFDEFIKQSGGTHYIGRARSKDFQHQATKRLRSASGKCCEEVLSNGKGRGGGCKTPDAAAFMQRVDIGSALNKNHAQETVAMAATDKQTGGPKITPGAEITLRKRRGSREETAQDDVTIGVDALETESASTKDKNDPDRQDAYGKEFTQAIEYTKIIHANQSSQPSNKIKKIAAQKDLPRVSPKKRSSNNIMQIVVHQQPQTASQSDASPLYLAKEIKKGPMLTKQPQSALQKAFVDKDLPQTVLIQQFLDNNQTSHVKQAFSSPFRAAVKKSTGTQPNVNSVVNSAVKQPPTSSGTKQDLKTSSPNRDQFPGVQKQIVSTAMKEKMEHTVTQIDNFMDPNSVKARTEFNFLNKTSTIAAILMGSPLHSRPQAKKKKMRARAEGFLEKSSTESLNNGLQINSCALKDRVKVGQQQVVVVPQIPPVTKMNTSDRSHVSPRKSFVNSTSAAGSVKSHGAAQINHSNTVKSGSFVLQAAGKRDKQNDSTNTHTHAAKKTATGALGAQLQQVIMTSSKPGSSVGTANANNPGAPKYPKSNKFLSCNKLPTMMPFAMEGELSHKSPRMQTSRNHLNDKKSTNGRQNKGGGKKTNRMMKNHHPLRSSSQTNLESNITDKTTAFHKRYDLASSSNAHEDKTKVKGNGLKSQNAIGLKSFEKLHQLQSPNPNSAKRPSEKDKSKRNNQQKQLQQHSAKTVTVTVYPSAKLNIKAPNKQVALTKSISAHGDQNIENVEDQEMMGDLDEQVTDQQMDFTPQLSDRQQAQAYFSSGYENDINNNHHHHYHDNDAVSPSRLISAKSPTGPQEPKVLEENSNLDNIMDSDPYYSHLRMYSADKEKQKRIVKSYQNSLNNSVHNSHESSPQRWKNQHKRQNQVLFYPSGPQSQNKQGPNTVVNMAASNTVCNSFLTVVDHHQNQPSIGLHNGKRSLQDLQADHQHVFYEQEETINDHLMDKQLESPAQELSPKDPHFPKHHAFTHHGSSLDLTSIQPFYGQSNPTNHKTASVDLPSTFMLPRPCMAEEYSVNQGDESGTGKNVADYAFGGSKSGKRNTNMQHSTRQGYLMARSGQSLGEAPHPFPIKIAAVVHSDKKQKEKNTDF